MHQEAFDNAKAAIAGAQMLSYLEYELPILLRTDACGDGAGVLSTFLTGLNVATESLK